MTPDKDVDLLVIGDCCPDIILSGGSVRPDFGQAENRVSTCTFTLGGSAAITACRAAELGLRVALVSVVGDDLFGRHTRDLVAAHRVDVSAVRLLTGLPTGVTVVLSEPDDRAILTAPGTIELLTAEDVPHDLRRRARHIHVSSYFLQLGLQPDLPALFRNARAAGSSTSLDTNWDPSSRWDLSSGLLDSVDVLCVNAEEAAHLTGIGDPGGAVRQLAGHGSTAVVKRGADPVLVAYRDRLWMAAPPAMPVTDAIGAGDSFNAGFLCEWIRSQSIPKALALGCAVGSLSTLSAGGTGAPIDPARAWALARTIAVTEAAYSAASTRKEPS